MAIHVTQSQREKIRELAASIRNECECRLGKRRPIKNPIQHLRSIRMLLSNLLRVGVSSFESRMVGRKGAVAQDKVLACCVYREYLVDGATGPVCDMPLVGKNRSAHPLYCFLHAHLCADDYCANLVEHPGEKCSQCQRAVQYQEGYEIKMSA